MKLHYDGADSISEEELQIAPLLLLLLRNMVKVRLYSLTCRGRMQGEESPYIIVSSVRRNMLSINVEENLGSL